MHTKVLFDSIQSVGPPFGGWLWIEKTEGKSGGQLLPCCHLLVLWLCLSVACNHTPPTTITKLENRRADPTSQGLKHPPQGWRHLGLSSRQHREARGLARATALVGMRASELTIHQPSCLLSLDGAACRCSHPGDEKISEPAEPRQGNKEDSVGKACMMVHWAMVSQV